MSENSNTGTGTTPSLPSLLTKTPISDEQSQSFSDYVLPFFVAVCFLGLMETEWITEELTIPTIGHEVAKVMIVVFMVYIHASITVGLETVRFLYHLLEMICPTEIKPLHGIVKQALKVIYSLVLVKLSVYLWKNVLRSNVCSAYNTNCQFSRIGKMITYGKQQMCGFNPKRTNSVMCQRVLDHLPLVLFALFFMIMGYALIPHVNCILQKRKLCQRRISKQQTFKLEQNLLQELKEDTTKKLGKVIEKHGCRGK